MDSRTYFGMVWKHMRIAFVTLYNHFAHGPRCLAAFLERAGHETMLLKIKRFVSLPVPREDPAARRAIEASGHMPVFEVHPFYDLACPYPTPLTAAERELAFGELARFAPDVIAFSLTSSHLPLARELSAEARRRFLAARLIWGGIYPTMDPDGCLEHADAVCVGEGEQALLEYVEHPGRTDIANIHFRAGAAAIRNPMRPLVKQLDSLPFPQYGDYELLIDDDRVLRLHELSPEERLGQLIISSTRGCPFNCSYCLHGVVRDMSRGQKYLRRKSVDRFLDEIAFRLKDYPLDGITFWDDIFMMDAAWCEEFAAKYPARIGLPFGGNCHPRTTTRHIMEVLQKAGAFFATIGVQTGSEYIAKEIYGRQVSNERYIEFGRDLIETGYRELVYDILSHCPFEREEDLRATALLLARMPKGRVTVKHIVLFPYTRITKLDAPRGNVSDEVYKFYEMLYLLAMQPGFDPALLAGLVDDPWLREHPAAVESWVRQLATLGQERDTLKAQRDALAARTRELEHQIPWGIKRATQHLATQLKSKLTRMIPLSRNHHEKNGNGKAPHDPQRRHNI